MDFVPKETRARWKSLESISAFGWCGSAALGGVLADKYGYNFTFLITAMVQGAAIVIWAFLIPLVPKQEAKAKSRV
jgi:predicted MFS family arabinose efflux permease